MKRLRSMVTGGRSTRWRGPGIFGRTWRGHAAVRADERPVGAWDSGDQWDHPASIRDGHRHGADHGRAGCSSGWHTHPGGAIVIVKQGTETVHKAVAANAWSKRAAPGMRSSNARAKWIRSLTPARSPSSIWSLSRVCRRAAPRELTSRIPERAQVSDGLTSLH
jgi:hypothetical protein